MSNEISGKSIINKMAQVAKAAVPSAPEITEVKKNNRNMADNLNFIKDKVKLVGKTSDKKGKKVTASPRVKRLAALTESIAEMGLAETKDGKELNDYQQLGVKEAALRMIGGMEINHEEEDPWVDFFKKPDELEAQELQTRISRMGAAAGAIAGDNTEIKEPAQGLKDRLTGKTKKINAKHTAQRKETLEATGVELLKLAGREQGGKKFKAITAAEASPHNTLEAIEQQTINAGNNLSLHNPKQTRKNLKNMNLYYQGLAKTSGDPQESRNAGIISRILDHALSSAAGEKGAMRENGVYLGALKVIDSLGESFTGTEEIVAWAADDLSHTYQKSTDAAEVFPDLLACHYYYRSKEDIKEAKAYNRAHHAMDATSRTSGLAALKILSEGLDCQAAQRIIASDKTESQKLDLLSKLDK